MALSDDCKERSSEEANGPAAFALLAAAPEHLARLPQEPRAALCAVAEMARQLGGAEGVRIESLPLGLAVAAGWWPAGVEDFCLPPHHLLQPPRDRPAVFSWNDDKSEAQNVDNSTAGLKAAGVRSYAHLALTQGWRSLGVMVAVSPRPGEFTESRIASLRVLGAMIAAALLREAEREEGRAALAEHNRALTGLKESEERFRQLIEQAGDAIFVFDERGWFVEVNPRACRSLGYTRDELLRLSVHDIETKFSAGALADLWKGVLAGGEQTVEGEQRRRDGSTFPVEIRIAMIQGRGRRMLLAIARDTTDRRRARWLEEDHRNVLEGVAQDQPLAIVLQQLVRLIERQMPGVRACLLILQDGSLRPFAPGLPPELCEALARHPVSFASRLTPDCGPDGRPGAVRVAYVDSDRAWEGLRSEASRAGVRCGWALPVRAKDGVPLGFIVACGGQSREPLPAEVAVLEAAAALATLAVEHHQTTRQLAHLIRHDPLTGLPNRLLYEDRLQQALTVARRADKPLALLAMDLDHFKQVNDTLGHHAGDELLQQFAQRLLPQLRESDTLARVGGDEFMVILPDVGTRQDIEAILSRLRGAMSSQPFEVSGRRLFVGCSIGVALWPADGDEATSLQRAADAAMYRAKAISHQDGVSGLPAALNHPASAASA